MTKFVTVTFSKGNMTMKLAVASLLTLFYSSAAAEWVPLTSTETYALYADPSTIRRDGHIAKMLHLIDYKMVQTPAEAKPYKSTRCSRKMIAAARKRACFLYRFIPAQWPVVKPFSATLRLKSGSKSRLVAVAKPSGNSLTGSRGALFADSLETGFDSMTGCAAATLFTPTPMSSRCSSA